VNQKKQNSLSIDAEGLPPTIQQLIHQADAEMVEYSGRASDVEMLKDWLAKGDNRLAEFQAKQIVERQQQFRQAKQQGLPADLQRLIDQANADLIEYSGRAADVEMLNDWLAKGDHRLAKFQAKQIVERQQQFRQAQQQGLPADLQQLIDQANAELIEYSGRAADVEMLNDWLAKGDHRLAEFQSRQIVERQRNIRNRS
jgi:acylphosphatase